MVGRNLTFGLTLEGMNSRPIDEVNKKMDQMKESGKGAGSMFDDMQKKMESAGKSMGKAGKSLTKGLTLPLVGIGTAAVAVGKRYEESMSEVQAISQASDADMVKLKESAREMGAQTRYSASEAADALKFMSLAGWDATQSTTALPEVLSLATAGGLELAEASDILTDTMSMFGIVADDANIASDAFAKAQAISNTNVNQLSEALLNAGPAAAAAGADLQQTSAILGVFANQGVKGGRAGTALNAMFRDIKASAEDGAVAIGESSVAVYDANGNMRAMGDIMADVESATEGMTGAQRDAALSNVFQQQSLSGVNLLLAEGSEKLQEIESEIYNSEGAASQMAETMDNNLNGSLTNMKSALEEAGLQLYDMAGGPINNLVKGVTEIIRKFSEMSDSAKQWVIIGAGIAAAIGPVLLIGGKLLTGASKIMTVFKAVGVVFAGLSTPILLLVGGLTVLGVSLVALWQTNEQFREIVTGVWGQLTEIVGSAVEYINTLWQTHGDTLMSVASGAWSLITGIITGAMQVIQGVINVVLGVIQGDWDRVWTGIQGIFEGVMTAISAAWNVVKELISAGIKGTVDAITDKFHSAVDRAKEAWEGLKNFMKNPIKGTVNAARKGAGWVKDKVSGSHASGAYNIPHDNYLANLHQGEMVLTASASDQFRAMGGTENSVPRPQSTSTASTSNTSASFSPTVNITIEGEASGDNVRDLERMMRNVFKREQASFFENLQLQQS